MTARAILRSKATLDSKNFDVGMTRMKQNVQAFTAGGLRQLSGVMGSAFAVGAVVRFTKMQMQAADRTMDLVANLGVQAETFQALEASALAYGGTVQQVEKALILLRRAQGEAQQRNPEIVAAFERLNIPRNGSTEQALEALAKGFKAAGQGGSALADVQKILGKGGAELAGVLADVADNGLQGIIDKGKEAGTVLDNNVVAALSRANNALEIMGKQAGNRLTRVFAGIGVAASDANALYAAMSAVGPQEAWRQYMGSEIGISGALKKEESQRKADADRRAEAERIMQAQMRSEQIASIEKQHGEKRTAAEKARDEKIAGITVGAVNAADQLAQRGGYIGGQASYQSAIAERQARMLEIMAKSTEKILELDTERNAKLAAIVGSVED